MVKHRVKHVKDGINLCVKDVFCQQNMTDIIEIYRIFDP